MNPIQEVAERAAQSIPGLSAAAAAVGLQDHRASLHSHQSRVSDSHIAQMKALGIDKASEVEEMGDIVITGDIHAPNPDDVVRSLRGERLPVDMKQRSILPTLALIGASLAGGAGLPYLLPILTQQLVSPQIDQSEIPAKLEPSQSQVRVENDYRMKIYRD